MSWMFVLKFLVLFWGIIGLPVLLFIKFKQ